MFLSTALGAALLCITGVSADSRHDGLNMNKQLDCYKESECRFLKSYQCKPGYKNVGFDRSICGRPFNGQPICCSTETVQSFGNKRCEWKGFGPNCNGAGEAGEVNLFKSGNGGYPTEGNRGVSDDQCHTGYKYFACPLPHWQELVSGCRVTGCDEGCGTDENEITSLRNDEPSRCDYPTVGKKYCCKKQDEAPLSNCHWVGRGHCDDNTCNPDEVTALRNEWGDTSTCSCKSKHTNE